jgi:hypothetical protein
MGFNNNTHCLTKMRFCVSQQWLPNNPLLSKADWCRFYIHLRSLNLNYFKKVEAMGLKNVALRSPSVVHLSAEFHKKLPAN